MWNRGVRLTCGLTTALILVACGSGSSDGSRDVDR